VKKTWSTLKNHWRESVSTVSRTLGDGFPSFAAGRNRL
jgi:hypothetical protein